MQSLAHDAHFIVRDPLGEPVANMRYKIRSADGVEIDGATDEHGRITLFTSDKIEQIELLFVQHEFPEDKGVN
jgi:type VI secretion system secreted protein VgrG